MNNPVLSIEGKPHPGEQKILGVSVQKYIIHCKVARDKTPDMKCHSQVADPNTQ